MNFEDYKKHECATLHVNALGKDKLKTLVEVHANFNWSGSDEQIQSLAYNDQGFDCHGDMSLELGAGETKDGAPHTYTLSFDEHFDVTTNPVEMASLKLKEIKVRFESGEIKNHEYAALRYPLVRDGLLALAKAYNFPAKVTPVADNELMLSTNTKDDNVQDPATFGGPLANLLNTVYVRTGVSANKGFVLPSGGWVIISYNNIEDLIGRALS